MAFIVKAVLAVAIAYGAGFVANAQLEDECNVAGGGVMKLEPRFFRSDCVSRSPSGRVRAVGRGDSEVFVATFAAALVIAFALLASLAALIRLVLVLGALAVAIVVIFF